MALLIFSASITSNAAIEELEFSGTYIEPWNQVVQGNFNYSLTYDTSLDTNTEFYAAGQTIGTRTTTHEWYGYSDSGVTDMDVTFDSRSWLASDFAGLYMSNNATANLWFDTDIAVATPTRMWVALSNTDTQLLELGGSSTNGSSVWLDVGSSIEDLMGTYFVYTESLSISSQIVPEPTTLSLLAVGGLALLRRKQRA